MSEQSRKPVSARPRVGSQSLLIDLLMRPFVSLLDTRELSVGPEYKVLFTHAMPLVLATALDKLGRACPFRYFFLTPHGDLHFFFFHRLLSTSSFSLYFLVSSFIDSFSCIASLISR
ncbi:hypothetical protein M441DRAFT_306586 [Trichoderma asperellum CBS 433.97]|uniref:Uncharacterized protein n=1 Tax=Trichoderma asperellum (strain ATCC 204424 / CBS 433.97 / NBRC 101777) TaxID=1042311 RepID=A0A2T3ZK08_TRIA4|nr:hypothetical protein M441DRAFT_306586 [Trichoderma asperellum CBS 433.97]PTB45112.1 hypothetical protein M441DRAFT_306586 [Trichoderma asperellum CBS 433.97]